ncbi:FAD-dependent monooxygenase [Nonomuraea dietziae]|uniref:2-polyprenyl-6-methoxyphenol hydroxylase-like FAD-dependent oxidoreductase n=2 Tax=Nonomuraea dietziae TaxID=65515 RepID=A0A7W5UX12_9ACTN|nr:FAD-dependent monooxygenase [Nonomuraea dietziae]MBB3724559.1 2-polyprenyl-6-methoxyphenol hydroxylase-like FAD-dependent oxidoreductase [Nonomuraea dietziae]
MTGHAIVIGGGIGGLAAAVALRRTGWQVNVLERVSAFAEVGAGLSQSPNAMRALAALGLGEQARQVSMPTWATHTMRLPSGRHLMRAPAQGDPPLRAFRRSALHRLLRQALPEDVVRTGIEVTGLTQDAEKVTITHTADRQEADLVIGADGIHSVTRRLLWPHAPGPRFLGYTAWLGLADTPIAVSGSMTMGRGRYFLIHPVAPGQVYWALGTAADQPGVRFDDELEQVRRRIDGWHDPIATLLKATPPEQVRHIDIHDLPDLPSFTSGRVALLGDAAHAMSPDRGQGAGQSIEDAVVLAAALATHGTVPEALTAYDAQRRPRTQTTARNARQAGSQVIHAGPVAHILTALALRLTPSALWERLAPRALGPLWDWVPPTLPDGAAPK